MLQKTLTFDFTDIEWPNTYLLFSLLTLNKNDVEPFHDRELERP